MARICHHKKIQILWILLWIRELFQGFCIRALNGISTWEPLGLLKFVTRVLLNGSSVATSQQLPSAFVERAGHVRKATIDAKSNNQLSSSLPSSGTFTKTTPIITSHDSYVSDGIPDDLDNEYSSAISSSSSPMSPTLSTVSLGSLKHPARTRVCSTFDCFANNPACESAH